MNYCSITSNQINTFIKKCFDASINVRSLVIYQGDKLLSDISIPPYQSSDVQQVYSISKSFTSTAIGLLYDQGLLCLDDHLVDIFEEESPKDVSAFLRQMKVKHLLSMNTGHALDTTERILSTHNPVIAFLSLPIEFEPGSHFTYNTGASYMLSAIVTKITGISMHEFLSQHLFDQLDIQTTYWGCDILGINSGGIDLHISNTDVNKLGRLYLNKGIYQNKRILSFDWVLHATKKVSNTDFYDYSKDWKVGYGYQFWMNDRNGFRADGAYGQICLVDPEKDIVFTMLSETSNMQDEVTLMQELISDMTIGNSHEDLELDYYTPLSSNPKNQFFENTIIVKTTPNQWNFKKVAISRVENKLMTRWEHEKGTFELIAGDGEFIYNQWNGPRMVRKLFSDFTHTIEHQRCYASFMESSDRILIQLRYTNIPHNHLITITKENNQIDIELMSSFNFYGNDKTHIKGELLYE